MYFVLLMGVVIFFCSTQAARDLWLTKLSDVVNVEKAKEPANTNIQVTFYDQATNIEYGSTPDLLVNKISDRVVCTGTH